jgi:amylosucrase
MNATTGAIPLDPSALLERTLPGLETLIAELGADHNPFSNRLRAQFPRLHALLQHLYSSEPDFESHVHAILTSAAQMYAQRPSDLRDLDARREADPLWFQRETMMGAVCYVDRFADTLDGLCSHIDYLKSLGVTYLHLMPLFKCPPERNDGGYAVSSFREVNPTLGTMAELEALAQTFRQHGISLVLDFVFNHTSDEHEWAQAALHGDPKYQAYYRLFDSRALPDQYERHLREIFPEQAPGSFTFRPEINKWVWTTFFTFQWDLNYANPDVFRAMLEEMLFLANHGVEVLRLDAVPFIWKKLGTNCENLPEAHMIIQAYSALVKTVAPAMLFKSEAIVHPRDVMSYIGWRECQLSYNPILMVCLWDALATRDIRLLRHTMQKRFALPPDVTWINYIRSHDDIGWGFADEDAGDIGINGFDHRFFLNMFYTGRFPGSFAAGLPFNYNPRTQDMRISGTTASLIGLEKALQYGDAALIEHAVRRILLMQAVVLSAGGIPLIYLGDELATTNDYAYKGNPDHADDSRWAHRPKMDWKRAERRKDRGTLEGRVFHDLQRLIRLRKALPMLTNGETAWIDTGSFHVLAFTRHHRMLVLANFSEHEQTITPFDFAESMAPDARWVDAITGREVNALRLVMAAYEVLWLIPRRDEAAVRALKEIDAGVQPSQRNTPHMAQQPGVLDDQSPLD